MKKLLVTSAVALAFSMAATAANATVFNLPISGGTGSFSAPDTYNASTVYNNTYNFAISSISDLAAVVTSTVFVRIGGGVTSFSLTNLTTSQTFSATPSVTTTGGVRTSVFAIDKTFLTVGNYALNIAGKGTYGGNIYLTSAVPEASTTAMMLGGLALVGFMATRRRRKEEGKSFTPSAMAAA